MTQMRSSSTMFGLIITLMMTILVSVSAASSDLSGSDSSAIQSLNCTIGEGDQQDNATTICAALELLTAQLGFIPASWGTQFGPPCFWPGITCAPHSSQIISLLLSNCPLSTPTNGAPQLPSLEGFPLLQNLSLTSCNLVGTLPANWSWTLPKLQHLDLNSNSLSGTLPPAWSNMTELQTIFLFSNNLIGPLPEEWSRLPRLVELDLGYNQLVGTLADAWGNHSSLRGMGLLSNSIAGTLPESWSHLTELQQLLLSDNQLMGTLPASWANMSSLIVLYLAGSSPALAGTLPPEWGRLTRLQALDLSVNQLLNGTLPPSWSGMAALQSLDLSVNQLAGTLPAEWGKMTALNYLNLRTNQLNGTLPKEWSNMRRLNVLHLWQNQLTGSIPTEWNNFPAMQQLDLHWNQLTGTLPAEWGKWDELVVLTLHGNQLTGTLPSAWSSLSGLVELSLHSNNLTGTLPPEWGNMTSLWTLHLYVNNLTGTLPASWGNMTAMGSLILQYSAWHEFLPGPLKNKFTGMLPPEWSHMSGIQQLYLSDSQITGTLPPEWCNMTQLQDLSIHTNLLTGTLPVEYKNLTALQVLLLHRNDLTGTLPPEWGSMTAMRTMYLYFNQLSGSLPAEWGNWSLLTELDLSVNQLNGSLPPQWRAMSQLTRLHLYSNQLSGSLPGEWGAMPSLQVLGLSSNALTGTLPNSWITMVNLNMLDLSINHLSGTLPALNGSMQVLRLGENALTGEIPTFSNMTNLQVLDVAYNQLTSFPPHLSEWAPNLIAFLGSNNNFRATLPRGIANHPLCALDVSGNRLQGTTDPTHTSSAAESYVRFVELGDWLQLWVLSISGNDWSGPAVYFNSTVNSTRVAPCQTTFGYSRYVDFASTNFSFGGLTQQTPSSTQAEIEAADAALRRDDESVTAFSVRSSSGSTSFLPCPSTFDDRYPTTCTCGEICVPNALIFGSAFNVTPESYIVGASVVALIIGTAGVFYETYQTCGCFTSNYYFLYSTFLGNDFTSTLTVRLDPPEPSASLWSGVSMVVPPTPSAFIPLGSGTLVANLRFGVEYVLRGEMFSRPRFRAQGNPQLLITGRSKKFQRLTCASSLQVPIWNSTLCGLCPTYANCDGTRNMTTSVAAWRPQPDLLPLQKCDFMSDGCVVGGDGTTCEIGYEGTLCGACSAGFGRGWSKCELCPAVDADSQLTVALIVVAAILYVCFVAYSALSLFRNPAKVLEGGMRTSLQSPTEQSPLHQVVIATEEFLADREGGPEKGSRAPRCALLKACASKVKTLALPLAVSLKIITNHMAMMALIGAAAVRPSPSSASSATTTAFFSIQNVIGNLALFDTVSVDCAARKFVEGPAKLIAVIAVFVAFPILGALVGVLMRSISCLRNRTIWRLEESLGFGLLPLAATMFAVVRVLQPSVVEYSAKLLPCSSLTFYDSAEYLLHQLGQLNGTVPAPKLQFYSSPEYRSLSCANADGSWPKYRIGAMVCLTVVGFGIPLLLALIVRGVERGKESGSYCAVVFSYFMKNFRPETYLWEFVLMLRLAVGWGILALFQEDRLQFSVLMMFLALFWMFHAHAAPYRTFRWNACEHLTYSAAIITLNCYDAVTTYANELSEAKASGGIIDENANLLWQRTFELISTVIQMVALAAVILGAIPREWLTCCEKSQDPSQTEDSPPEGDASRGGAVSTSYGSVNERSATLLRETERSEVAPPERHSTRKLISSNFRFRRRTGEFTGGSVNEDHPTMELALLVAKMNEEDHDGETRGDSSASSA